MRKDEVARGRAGRVVVVDSITQLADDDRDAVVVAGSHGGRSSGEIALAAAPLTAVFFNDAGVGKDRAGIVALAMLQAHGIAAGTVAHTSARIGDGFDAWQHGVISHLNDAAKDLGLGEGRALRPQLLGLIRLRRD